MLCCSLSLFVLTYYFISESGNISDEEDIISNMDDVNENINYIPNGNLFTNVDFKFTDPAVTQNHTFTMGEKSTTSEAWDEFDLNKAHLVQTLQSLRYIRSLNYEDYRLDRKQSSELIASEHDVTKLVELPRSHLFKSDEETKTLIFDLGKLLTQSLICVI